MIVINYIHSKSFDQ